MNRRLLLVALSALLAASASACGAGEVAAPKTAQAVYGACPVAPESSKGVTYEPIFGPNWQLFADPAYGRFRIDSMGTAPTSTHTEGPTGAPLDTPMTFRGQVTVKLTDLATSQRREQRMVFTPIEWAAIDHATQTRAQIVAFISPSDLDPSQPDEAALWGAAYLLILPTDGTQPFFAGQCAERDMATPLREALGAGYVPALKAVLAGEVPSIPEPPGADPAARILAPGDIPEEILAGLRHTSLAITLPAQWGAAARKLGTSGYAVGTQIEDGWNDFFPVEMSRPETPVEIGAYLSKSGGNVTFWLLAGDADPAQRVHKLGTLDVARLTARRGVVQVTVRSTSNFDDLIAGTGESSVTVTPAG